MTQQNQLETCPRCGGNMVLDGDISKCLQCGWSPSEEAPTPAVEEPVETKAKPDYDLHIKVPAEMRSVLQDSTALAFKLGDITKPDLVNLMNLFIGWGLQIQKQKWLDRVGYQ